MSQVLDFDVRDAVVSDGTFGPQEIKRILNAVSNESARLAVLRDAVAELEARDDHTPASLVRLGVCQFLLGRYEQAVHTLSRADGGASLMLLRMSVAPIASSNSTHLSRISSIIR